jgi:hypothetical protein
MQHPLLNLCGQVIKFFAALPPCLVGMEACASAHIALANKMARIAWALLARGGIYRAPRLAAA